MDTNVNNLLEKVKVSAEMVASYTGKAATRAADAAGKTATTVMETTKMNLQIFDLNTELEILYKEIGKIVYDVHCGIEVDQDDIQTKLDLIDEKRQKIEEIRENLNEVKSDQICPNCGKSCSKEDTFCSCCGAQL